jgi:hypothetical protein
MGYYDSSLRIVAPGDSMQLPSVRESEVRMRYVMCLTFIYDVTAISYFKVYEFVL